MIRVSIANRQRSLPVDRAAIRRLVRSILQDAGFQNGSISVAVVDDPAIGQLHAEFLGDPDPTDVLSFVLEQSADSLEGEVIVSADTARANAQQYKQTAEQELLLYVIHGSLHLVGYDDTSPRKRAQMRKMEKHYMVHNSTRSRG